MNVDELLSRINEEGISEEEKKTRIKDLHGYIRQHNHLHDDHGPVIVGHRDHDLHFLEDIVDDEPLTET